LSKERERIELVQLIDVTITECAVINIVASSIITFSVNLGRFVIYEPAAKV
jgi:hypothetical protein